MRILYDGGSLLWFPYGANEPARIQSSALVATPKSARFARIANNDSDALRTLNVGEKPSDGRTNSQNERILANEAIIR